jgi:hypothetical protein
VHEFGRHWQFRKRFFGGPLETRTLDPLIKSHICSQILISSPQYAILLDLAASTADSKSASLGPQTDAVSAGFANGRGQDPVTFAEQSEEIRQARHMLKA